MIKKVHVFVFFGEFGYELLNWQGRVNKFYKTLPKDEIIVCAGRKGLDVLYPSSSYYYDLTQLDFHKTSHACIFWMIPKHCNGTRGEDCTCNVCEEGRQLIESTLTSEIIKTLSLSSDTSLKFIYSDKNNNLNNIGFGKAYGRIYNGFPYQDNLYTKLVSNSNIFEFLVKNKINNVDGNDYVLCQSGYRPSHGDVINENTILLYTKFIDTLLKRTNVIFIDFETGMVDDSKSSGYELNSKINQNLPYKFHRVNCSGLQEQILLVENSKFCMFFTLGDLRSHTYIPPFAGKDVKVIHSDDVNNKAGVGAVNYWNTNVFLFGGKMELFNQNKLTTEVVDSWI